jgi:hypothetical protein
VEEADDYLRIGADCEVRTADDPAVDQRERGVMRYAPVARRYGRNAGRRDGGRGR